jgi:hypothetical protein
MAVLELYGKCKELGYCDCGGFLGCVDDGRVQEKPDGVELDRVVKSLERSEGKLRGSAGKRYAANEPLVALVECEVCDRSHAPSHRHIANIDGDVPIDDVDLDDAPESQSAAPARELPDWLKDKPGSQMIRPATTPPTITPTCGVCGEPWAPKHACKGAEPPETDFNRPARHGATKRLAATCDVCGLIKRSNHNCRGGSGRREALYLLCARRRALRTPRRRAVERPGLQALPGPQGGCSEPVARPS